MGFSNSKEETAKLKIPAHPHPPTPKQPSEPPTPKPKYQIISLLGQGTSGKVYKCVDPTTNLHYAMKIITLTSKTKPQAIQQIENLKRQISLLKKLNHRNIVKYISFDVNEDLKSVEIVLQKVTPGNLRDLVKGRPMKEEEASKVCRELLQALKYLHGQGIVHRDLKGANILVDGQGVPKISDFGTARVLERGRAEDNIASKCRSLKGTPYWMAPEVLKRTGHTFSADIWSLGCTLIEMLTGKPPWSGLSNKFQEIIGYIASGIQPPFPPKISKTCQKFLNCCLDTNPNKRLKAQQLLNHPFIRQPCTQDSIEQIDIQQLQSLHEVHHHNRPFSHKLKTQQTQIQTQQTPNQPLTSKNNTRTRVSSKVIKQKDLNNRPSLKVIDMIETKASRKEREELEERQRAKEIEKREKAVKWEEELKAEANRVARRR